MTWTCRAGAEPRLLANRDLHAEWEAKPRFSLMGHPSADPLPSLPNPPPPRSPAPGGRLVPLPSPRASPLPAPHAPDRWKLFPPLRGRGAARAPRAQVFTFNANSPHPPELRRPGPRAAESPLLGTGGPRPQRSDPECQAAPLPVLKGFYLLTVVTRASHGPLP